MYLFPHAWYPWLQGGHHLSFTKFGGFSFGAFLSCISLGRPRKEQLLVSLGGFRLTPQDRQGSRFDSWETEATEMSPKNPAIFQFHKSPAILSISRKWFSGLAPRIFFIFAPLLREEGGGGGGSEERGNFSEIRGKRGKKGGGGGVDAGKGSEAFFGGEGSLIFNLRVEEPP